jgi:hypothetical protein
MKSKDPGFAPSPARPGQSFFKKRIIRLALATGTSDIAYISEIEDCLFESHQVFKEKT